MKKINTHRFILGIIFLLPLILIMLLWRDKIFYTTVTEGINMISPRFWWSISCSCFGFGVLTLHNVKNTSSPFPSYYFYYPILLIIISSLIFSILHLFTQTSNYIYYYFSFPLCFIFGYMVDYFWQIMDSIIKLIKKS